MKPDETPPPGKPGTETPPASLTAVRVKRGSAAAEPSSKRGDLTQQLSLPVTPLARRDPPPLAVPVAPEDEPSAPPPLTAEAAPARAASAPVPAQPPTPVPRLLDEEEVRMLLDPPSRRSAQAAPAAPEARLTIEPDERAAAVPPPPAELRLVVDAPESAAPPAGPPKAETPPEPEAKPSAPGRSSMDEIIDYWDSLRSGGAVPRLDALDRTKVAGSWPNCLLVAFGATETVTPQLTRLGGENGEIEYSEMVIHWILSQGRLAARNGEPMEEEKRFPVTGGGNARYQLLLLPLATPEGRSEHVLCHLTRIKEAAKGGFKRWLAS